MNQTMNGSVQTVCKSSNPGLPKHPEVSIHLIENFGIEGDYHAGELIRHRYLVGKDPSRKNNRQVLLMDSGIYAGLAAQGIVLKPGMLGENILLDGIDIMDLPLGAILQIGESELELTEVRNPCYQLNEMHPGLEKAVQPIIDGQPHKNAGMLAVILKGGQVQAGDSVKVIIPDA